MTEYLRGRPFLCVSFIQRPSPNVNTSKAGWQEEKNAMITYDNVVILDRVNNLRNYGLVIDIINSKIIKNNTDHTDEDLQFKYMSKYKDEIKQSLMIWAKNEVKLSDGA